MTRRVLILLLPAVLAALSPGQDPPNAKVNFAIDKGVRALLEIQKNNGYFSQRLGIHGLAMLALMHSGMEPTDTVLQRAKRGLRLKPTATYDVGIRLMVIDELDDDTLRDIAKDDVKALIRSQGLHGGWRYDFKERATDFDNSCTQYAILGLRAAHNMGIPIPAITWRRALRHQLRNTSKIGGMGYQGPGANVGLTAGGLSSIVAISSRCTLAQDHKDMRRARACIKAMKKFLERRWKGGRYYADYALERGMAFSRTKKLGKRDWYGEGADILCDKQSPDGTWGRGKDVTNTSFALLFLTRASKATANETPSSLSGLMGRLGPQARKAMVDVVVEELVSQGKAVAPAIVPYLLSEHRPVREAAVRALRKITGQTFAYDPKRRPKDNRAAIARWRESVAR